MSPEAAGLGTVSWIFQGNECSFVGISNSWKPGTAAVRIASELPQDIRQKLE